ncbi:uncharacterized protein LOC117823048 [Notolabrus celidotus]|uniref:uncharacterized protein LOC117823048 n=1 Tax=Notolabrus celidotus TaxID=1203425 RepID=UPI00148F4A3A|nr:uncharacterized protein LOC117823048 [Notolabrus celidotus]
MASTPSASALSAVLRCRGNIWARNPPTKRPATSAYSLGLAGGVVRDSPAEEESVWEAFLRGERVIMGRRLAVAYECPRVDGTVRRGKDSEDMNKLCHPKLSQSPGHARSDVHGVPNALVRQLTRTLTPNLPGVDKCSKIIHRIKYGTNAAHICKVVFVRECRESPAGVFKVSITSPCLVQNTGQIPSFMSTGWSTLKSTCLSLTTLVSELIFMKLVCRSSSNQDDAPQLLLNQQGDRVCRNLDLHANGQTPSHRTDLTPTSSVSGQRITEDRPD